MPRREPRTRRGTGFPASTTAVRRDVPLALRRDIRAAGAELSILPRSPGGTVAVEMDPLSLLCRLAMMVPPPRFHTVKYAGVLAAASKLRAQISPQPVAPTDAAEAQRTPRRGSYWP